MRGFQVGTDWSFLEKSHVISRQIGEKSLLQLGRGQPVQQAWLDDFVFSVETRQSCEWPDFEDFGAGLFLVSRRLRDMLESACACAKTPYQFLTPTWKTNDYLDITSQYSIMNLLDIRRDALVTHESRLFINRKVQFDAEGSVVVEYNHVRNCDHIVRLSAAIVIVVDKLAQTLSEGKFFGLGLTPIQLGNDYRDKTEQSDAVEP